MTLQQINYESVCKALQDAGIDFLELDTQGYKVKFQLSKGDVKATAIIDCDSSHIDADVENAIKSIERLVEWNRLENEKKAKRSKNSPNNYL